MSCAEKNNLREVVLDKNKIEDSKKLYRFFKRVQDIVLSALALIVLFPVMLIVMAVVFFDMPSAKPIFVQKRVGKNGKKFRLYKFRTMVPGAEKELEKLLPYNEMEGRAFKMKNDPRITKVGRFLRKTSLDELPQLINIIKGDMSIVGPRPPVPREYNQYDDFDKQRLYITPGLTCYWQTLPNRNEIAFDKWVSLDIKYIRERSFLTDWKIILKTIPAVIGMNGI